MYRTGHFGLSLLLFAPVGTALLMLGEPALAGVAGIVMVGLSMLPDVDHELPFVAHRGPTHSVLFAVGVGCLFAGVGTALSGTALSSALGSSVSLQAFGFGLGVLTVGAHLLADTLTPMGVPYLWPVSQKAYSVRLCRADSSLGNYGLFVIGVTGAIGTLVLLVDAGLL